MRPIASQRSIHAFSSVVLATGMMLLPGTILAGQGMGSSPVGSGSTSAPDVQATMESGADVQWSDQLKKERDQAKQSRDQAQQERDQAKKDLEKAMQAGGGSQGDSSGMKSIQGQSSSGKMGSGSGDQEATRLQEERDKFLKERDALQEETASIREQRDRAMQSIAGGSPLDAVDRSMPTTPRN